VLAVAVLVALVLGRTSVTAVVLFGIAVLALVVQLVGVRPRLTRRSDAVLAGHEGPRSRVHYVYVALEIVKVIALAAFGVLLLA
jgi:hypothetical protein